MPEILAETPHLIAVNKPTGLITHSDGRTEEPSLAEWLIERYSGLSDVGDPWISPQGVRVRTGGLVHRLDRATSGVLIAARTEGAYQYLKGAFKERRVEKTYRAVVHGHLERGEGVVSAEIVRTSTLPRRWAARDREIGHTRTALTQWRVLGHGLYAGAPASFIELHPRTGRTHQIRVHMAHIGHPVIGDPLYAQEHAIPANCTRLMLHAYAIAFAYADGARHEYVAPMPPEFTSFTPGDSCA